MTQVPSGDPGPFEPTGLADRLAGSVRRHVLAAAQASLRALREILAQFPTADGETRRPARIAPPPVRTTTADPADVHSGRTSHGQGGALAQPPPAELLRTGAPLPVSYGSDRLVLLARDPHCLYAYWDLSDARFRGVRAQVESDQLRIVLRMYDVTQVAFDATPPTRFQDFAVAGDARSIYAYVGTPAACFVAEVGFLRPDGVFFPLARSQPVWTPRTDQPGAAPGRWMTVGWRERADAGAIIPLTATAGGSTDTGAAEGFATRERRAPSSWPGPLPSAAQRGSWSLVRGKLTTAAVPDDPPAGSFQDPLAARSEP